MIDLLGNVACREKGAILVDNMEIENVDLIMNSNACGSDTALLAEFKIGINEYLRELPSSPVRSLSDIIAFNKTHNLLVN